MTLEKVATLTQRHNDKTDRQEWALVSKHDPGKILKWFGTEKPSHDAVVKEERRVQWFKHNADDFASDEPVEANDNTSFQKVAYVVKEKSKWCVKSEEGKSVGCYKTKAGANKRLRQIEFFKHKKAQLLTKMVDVADDLDRFDLFVGDDLNDCITSISSDNFETAPIKLMKLGNLLDKKGHFNLAEDVDSLIPDVLELKTYFPR